MIVMKDAYCRFKLSFSSLFFCYFQLEMMRLLTTPNGTPMCNNFRPVRPLNGRKLIQWSPKQAKLPGRLRLQGIRLYH